MPPHRRSRGIRGWSLVIFVLAANVAYHNSPNPNVKDEQFSPLQPKATSHKAVKAKQAAGAKAAAKQEVAAGKGAGVLKPK